MTNPLCTIRCSGPSPVGHGQEMAGFGHRLRILFRRHRCCMMAPCLIIITNPVREVVPLPHPPSGPLARKDNLCRFPPLPHHRCHTPLLRAPLLPLTVHLRPLHPPNCAPRYRLLVLPRLHLSLLGVGRLPPFLFRRLWFLRLPHHADQHLRGGLRPIPRGGARQICTSRFYRRASPCHLPARKRGRWELGWL